MMTDNSRITLNVGGRRFVTFRSTLRNVPGTRLAKLSPSDPSYDPIKREYYFDRNPDKFGPILDYFRSGELHYAHCICGPSIKKELIYWDIDENSIAICCWKAYKEDEEERKTLKELKKILSNDDPDVRRQGSSVPCCPELLTDGSGEKWYRRWRCRLWEILDHPYSSRCAKSWAAITFILIMISIMVVAMETHPVFRVASPEELLEPGANFTNPKRRMFYETDLHPALYYMDSTCTLVFFTELTLRLICSPSKCEFFKSAFNIIDIFCVVPMTVVLFLQWTSPEIWTGSHFYLMISYLSLASVLRVFRLFKLARHYRGFKILHLAVRSSMKELFLLFILISTGMVIFSTLVYYAEFNEDNGFTSIPIGFWWSIITMTTVGYGEIVPTSGWGYVVGSACAIAGTLITGLPIPIIASNFNYYYNYSRLLMKMAERKDSSSHWRKKSRMTFNRRTAKGSASGIAVASTSNSELFLSVSPSLPSQSSGGRFKKSPSSSPADGHSSAPSSERRGSSSTPVPIVLVTAASSIDGVHTPRDADGALSAGGLNCPSSSDEQTDSVVGLSTVDSGMTVSETGPVIIWTSKVKMTG